MDEVARTVLALVILNPSSPAWCRWWTACASPRGGVVGHPLRRPAPDDRPAAGCGVPGAPGDAPVLTVLMAAATAAVTPRLSELSTRRRCWRPAAVAGPVATGAAVTASVIVGTGTLEL